MVPYAIALKPITRRITNETSILGDYTICRQKPTRRQGDQETNQASSVKLTCQEKTAGTATEYPLERAA